ncbi:MAG: 2-oxoglutarate dehydrogenase complex dihydrolipoyllysine-residue succinyltransferase [Gemmataceae bacterium]|nr:2-oxoglutarate dehydrogenase complex dihydrolipoyllysine-residue succinyltransferase [Gemmataceae bacterium]
MAIELKVPSAGESVTEARIARWMKGHGQAVKVDEPLFELETDKASLEIAAPNAGVLSISVPAGQMVKIGQVVGSIDPNGIPTVAPAAIPTIAPVAAPKDEGRPDVILSPAARAMVAESGVDPKAIAATGPGGRVTKEDVLNHSAPKPAPAPVKADGPRETRQPMTMIRRRIAERLLESQNTTATLSTFNEVDMTAAMDLRTKYNEKFEKKHGVKLGFMSIFARAAVEALKAFPLVNARIDGGDVVMQHFYDLGMAVSTEKGLMVPVVRNVDRLGFAEIEKEIAAVAKKARDGKITPADMMGGTFTITNGGIFGSMLSTPILNPPQSAILGLHSIQKRAVVVNDAIVIRPMMYLALSYDHRLIDGREAVQFLVRIKECVENPERMLLDI